MYTGIIVVLANRVSFIAFIGWLIGSFYWMVDLKIDMRNPVLVCGPMKFLLIKPC